MRTRAGWGGKQGREREKERKRNKQKAKRKDWTSCRLIFSSSSSFVTGVSHPGRRGVAKKGKAERETRERKTRGDERRRREKTKFAFHTLSLSRLWRPLLPQRKRLPLSVCLISRFLRLSLSCSHIRGWEIRTQKQIKTRKQKKIAAVAGRFFFDHADPPTLSVSLSSLTLSG